MNIKELIKQLKKLKIDKSLYSLNGELRHDTIILYNSYGNWEVFYLDERGGRNNVNIFNSEEKACDYIYKLFQDAKQIEDMY